MKTTSIMMEGNNQKADSHTASKNAGSFVKIDSISIDLNDGTIDKSYAGKCEHFSIRGYASEIRKQNWKLCWPFSVDDEKNKFPLDAPKFRWWSCQSCLQEINSKGTVNDHDNSHTNGPQSNGATFSQMPSLSNPAMLLPDFQQAPTPNMIEKTKSDVYPSIEVNRNVDQLPSSSNKEDLLLADAHTSFIGDKNGLENDVGREVPRLTFVPSQINSNVIQEKPKNDTDAEAIKLERNRSLEPCKHSSGKHEVMDVELAINMDLCKHSTKMYQTDKRNSAAGQDRESQIASGTSALACLNDETDTGIKGQTNGFGSRVLDDCNNASSESVEILVGQNLQDHNNDKSNGLQRRKTRKVRLLTELLCDNGDAKTDHTSTEDSPSSAIDNASAGVGMVSVPPGQVSLPENCREGLGDNKKRKLPHDEELRSTELSSQSNINKKVKSFKGGEQTANAITDSGLKEDASAGFYLQTGTKSYWSDSRNPVTGKKKNKKNQIIDAPLSLVPIGENFLSQIPGAVGISNKGIVDDSVSLKEVKDASTGRRMDKTPVESSRKERKSSSLKKKSKMPQVDDGHVPQFLWNSGLLKKGPTMRNEESTQTGPVNVSFRQAEDASAEIEKHPFSSYLGPQRYDKKYTPRVEDGLPSILSWKEGTPIDQIRRKNVETKYVSDSSIPSEPAYAFLNKRGHGEFSGKLTTYNFPIVKEKQKNNTQVEEGCFSLVKQVDISGARNSQKTSKGKEHSAVTGKHVDEIAGDLSEQGASDDIPMEIVELMAKNQYERRLDTAESKKCLLETANEARNNPVIDHNKVYGTKDFSIFEDPSERKDSRPRTGKNAVNTARKNGRPAKQKSVDYFSHINREQFDIRHLGQKKSSSVQFPSIGPSQCSCAQNCKWNGDVVACGFFHTGMQTGACDTCQIDSRLKDDAPHSWSSTISHNMPVRHKFPQKGFSQPTNFDMLSNGPDSLHKGNSVDRDHVQKFLNRSAPDLEKHSQNIGSETFGRRNSEYPFANKHNGVELQQNTMGSLDLYSNETIPAMHLLSLMDAGMQSGAAFKTGGNSKFLKRVSPPDHNSKEYSLIDFGVYNKQSDTAKRPLDRYGKNQLSEKSHDFFSVNPTVGSSTSTSHHNEVFERSNDFMGQVSFSPRRKEKVQRSGSAAQNRGHRALNSSFASGALGTNQNIIPVHGMQKGLLGASGSTVLPLQLHTTENSTEHKLETPHANGSFRPPKSNSESSICCINRNPADFSMPDAGNEYMIRGEDLKFGKLRKRNDLTGVDQRKQQRNSKRTTEKERGRH